MGKSWSVTQEVSLGDPREAARCRLILHLLSVAQAKWSKSEEEKGKFPRVSLTDIRTSASTGRGKREEGSYYLVKSELATDLRRAAVTLHEINSPFAIGGTSFESD